MSHITFGPTPRNLPRSLLIFVRISIISDHIAKHQTTHIYSPLNSKTEAIRPFPLHIKFPRLYLHMFQNDFQKLGL